MNHTSLVSKILNRNRHECSYRNDFENSFLRTFHVYIFYHVGVHKRKIPPAMFRITLKNPHKNSNNLHPNLVDYFLSVGNDRMIIQYT